MITEVEGPQPISHHQAVAAAHYFWTHQAVACLCIGLALYCFAVRGLVQQNWPLATSRMIGLWLGLAASTLMMNFKHQLFIYHNGWQWHHGVRVEIDPLGAVYHWLSIGMWVMTGLVGLLIVLAAIAVSVMREAENGLGASH